MLTRIKPSNLGKSSILKNHTFPNGTKIVCHNQRIVMTMMRHRNNVHRTFSSQWNRKEMIVGSPFQKISNGSIHFTSFHTGRKEIKTTFSSKINQIISYDVPCFGTRRKLTNINHKQISKINCKFVPNNLGLMQLKYKLNNQYLVKTSSLNVSNRYFSDTKNPCNICTSENECREKILFLHDNYSEQLYPLVMRSKEKIGLCNNARELKDHVKFLSILPPSVQDLKEHNMVITEKLQEMLNSDPPVLIENIIKNYLSKLDEMNKCEKCTQNNSITTKNIDVQGDIGLAISTSLIWFIVFNDAVLSAVSAVMILSSPLPIKILWALLSFVVGIGYSFYKLKHG